MRKCVRCLMFVLSLTIIFACMSCQTEFREAPPAHELLNAIEVWPDDYYWLIQTGVSSRVLGLRQPGESISEALVRLEQQLDAVRDQWANLSGFQSAQAIIEYLNTNDLGDVAGVIGQTLEANAAEVPSGETHAFLQARAIKEGLIDAYQKIKQR